MTSRGCGQATMSREGPKPTRRFFTPSGLEVPAVTEAQMRELDRVAMEETGPNLLQMMENAGRNTALFALEVLGDTWSRATVVVLAGVGGNGGGGICAARHLANRAVSVTLFLSEPENLRQAPAYQRMIFQATGGREADAVRLPPQGVDLIIDALVGYSLRSAPRGAVRNLIELANGTGAPILSLDVPSGVDSTTGETPGAFIRPSWTMTLALPKTGLVSERTGDLHLADIGIPEGTYRRAGMSYTCPFGNRFRVPLICR